MGGFAEACMEDLSREEHGVLEVRLLVMMEMTPFLFYFFIFWVSGVVKRGTTTLKHN